ncbi:MAG: hypothetical protein ACXWWK_01910 [Gemmatimonadales bacterium]
MDLVGERGNETRLFATQRGAVPYLNLSFALLEQAVRRARVSTDTSQVAFHNLGGGQTLISKLSRVGTDSLIMKIGHVQFCLGVDPAGRVLGAWIPAQDVIVETTIILVRCPAAPLPRCPAYRLPLTAHALSL